MKAETIVSVLIAIIGVAILAVLVSGSSNTSGILGSLGQSISCALGTAVSPVTGSPSGCSSQLTTNVWSSISYL